MPNCDNEDGNYAAFLISNTENGDTLALCGPCVQGWARIVLEGTGYTVSDPAPDWDTVASEPNPGGGGDADLGDDEHDEDEARGFAPGTIAAALGDLPPQDGEAASNGHADAEHPATPPAGDLADAPPY